MPSRSIESGKTSSELRIIQLIDGLYGSQKMSKLEWYNQQKRKGVQSAVILAKLEGQLKKTKKK